VSCSCIFIFFVAFSVLCPVVASRRLVVVKLIFELLSRIEWL